MHSTVAVLRLLGVRKPSSPHRTSGRKLDTEFSHQEFSANRQEHLVGYISLLAQTGNAAARTGNKAPSGLHALFACTIHSTEGEASMATAAERMRALRERACRGIRRLTIDDDLLANAPANAAV